MVTVADLVRHLAGLPPMMEVMIYDEDEALPRFIHIGYGNEPDISPESGNPVLFLHSSSFVPIDDSHTLAKELHSSD